MRFWAIKIIFLIAGVVCYSSVSHAKEYDFNFDVKNLELTQKNSTILSEANFPTISWRAGMHATILSGLLQGHGELVYGGVSESSTAGQSNWDKYLMKLGLSGKQDAFKFGLNFYSVGRNYEGKFNSEYRDKKGYSGYESWLSWNFKKLQVKTRYSEYWTKKTSEINQVRSSGRWYEIETSYPLTSVPFTEFSIAYRLGEKSRTNLFDHIKTYDGPLNSLKARFRFADDYLQSTLEVIQSSSQNNLDNRRSFQQEMIYFNSTLFPKNPLSIISSYRVSHNTDSSTTYKRKLNKNESSLGFVYKLPETLGNLKVISAYNNSRSDDQLIDLDIVKFGAQFNFNTWENNTGLKTSWTMDFRYDYVMNNINPDSNISNWSLKLLLNLPLS